MDEKLIALAGDVKRQVENAKQGLELAKTQCPMAEIRIEVGPIQLECIKAYSTIYSVELNKPQIHLPYFWLYEKTDFGAVIVKTREFAIEQKFV